MKKRFFAVFVCLCMIVSMLPVTALGAGSNTVYVGGVELVGSPDNIVYATTNESGEVVKDGANANNYNIKWDGSTLTLHDATIQKELYASDLPLSNIAGAAIGVINQSGDAGLTVQPQTGLGVGSHSETLTISGSNNTSASVALAFQVAPKQYPVTVENDGHSTAAASPASAVAGTTITLTATPNLNPSKKNETPDLRGMNLKSGVFFCSANQMERCAPVL